MKFIVYLLTMLVRGFKDLYIMNKFNDIRRKHNSLFVVCYELKNLMLDLATAAPDAVTPKDGVSYYLFTKVYRTFGNVINLVKDASTEDAEMLVRTTFDAYVTYANILKDETDETVMKYLEYDDVTRARMYKLVKDQKNFSTYFQQRLENPKEDDESIEEIESRAEEWKEKYKATDLNQWHSPLKSGEMARLVEMDRFHKTGYVMESHLIHSLPRVMNRYLSSNGERIIMDLRSKGHEPEMALIAGFNMSFAMSERFNSHFKLGFDIKLAELANKFEQVVKKENEN